MRGKSFKVATMSVLTGMVFQFGGCNIGRVFGEGFVVDVLRSAIVEAIWDNDAVFDFFGDDGPGLLL